VTTKQKRKPDVNRVEKEGKVKRNVKARKEGEREKETPVEHLIRAPIYRSEKLGEVFIALFAARLFAPEALFPV